MHRAASLAALLLLAACSQQQSGPLCSDPLPPSTTLYMGFCKEGPQGFCLYDVYADT